MSTRPNGGSFLAMLRSFSLQSTKDCCVKLPCLAKKSLAVGHISNFQTRPRFPPGPQFYDQLRLCLPLVGRCLYPCGKTKQPGKRQNEVLHEVLLLLFFQEKKEVWFQGGGKANLPDSAVRPAVGGADGPGGGAAAGGNPAYRRTGGVAVRPGGPAGAAAPRLGAGQTGAAPRRAGGRHPLGAGVGSGAAKGCSFFI